MQKCECSLCRCVRACVRACARVCACLHVCVHEYLFRGSNYIADDATEYYEIDNRTAEIRQRKAAYRRGSVTLHITVRQSANNRTEYGYCYWQLNSCPHCIPTIKRFILKLIYLKATNVYYTSKMTTQLIPVARSWCVFVQLPVSTFTKYIIFVI